MFLRCFKNNSGAEDDLYTLAGSDYVQVDIYGNNIKYRVDLHRKPKTEKSGQNRIGVWEINEKGWCEGDIYNLDNYEFSDGTTATYCGILEDGCFPKLDPVIFEQRLSDSLANLNPYNWRIVVGDENVPEGVI